MRGWSQWLGEDVTSVTARSLPTLGLRLAIAATSATLYILKISVAAGLIWAAAIASAEALVWVTSQPQRGQRSASRFERVAYIGAVTWMNVVWWAMVAALWLTGQPALRATALCLIAALLVHAQTFTARSRTLTLIVGGGAAGLLLTLGAAFNDFSTDQRLIFCAGAVMLIIYSAKAGMTNVRQARALEQAKASAEAGSKAKSDFLAQMSHEIRTPLNAMLGMAQAIKLQPLDASLHDDIEILEDSGRTLLALLNDLLDLAKIEAGKLEIALSPNDLSRLSERIVRLNLPLAREKGTDITLQVDGSVPPLLAFDPLRVRQCLTNLISNAVKFTTAGQILVRVSCKSSGQADSLMVKVVVADTGIGMSKAVLDKAFIPFTQADASTAARTGGTGLGLHITRRLAHMMGGEVSARSVEGKGSTFTLSFLASSRAAALGKGEEAGLPRRILVVDDYAINRKVVAMMLAPLGCQIAEAENGLQALEALEKEPFDMLLIDFNMPVMGGLDAARRLRADRRWASLPVLCLSAGLTDREHQAALEAGFSGFVDKPIDRDALLAAMRRHAAGASTPV